MRVEQEQDGSSAGQLQAYTRGLFRCDVCLREWGQEIPPIWGGHEMWPVCCETLVPLIKVGFAVFF